MEPGFIEEPLNYSCQPCKVSLPKAQLSAHLLLYGHHIISKLKPARSFEEDFKKLVSIKIKDLVTIQMQIQHSSVNLNQLILINTRTILNRLDQVIKLYKNLLLELPKSLDNNEIISGFCINSTLNSALIGHFQQQILDDSQVVERKSKTIKSKIFKLLDKKCDYFNCMVVSKSEEFIVTGGQSGILRIWDMNSNTQSYCLKKHKGSVNTLALSLDDSFMLSGSNDCTVRLWDLESKIQVYVFKWHQHYVKSVLISEDQKIGFSGSNDGFINIFNLESKELKYNLETFNWINQIILFDEEKIAVVGDDGIKFWDRNIGDFTEISKEYVSKIVFSPDEHHFITGGSNGNIKIWEKKSTKIIFEDNKHNQEITQIVFSLCGDFFVSCANENNVLIWDFKNPCVQRTLPFTNLINFVHFLKSSNSLIVLQFYYPIISNYNITTDINEQKINPKKLNLTGIAISSDLKYLAYCCLRLRLYDIDLKKIINEIILNEIDYCNLKFSPDSSYLGIGNESGKILVFSVPSLKQVHKFNFYESIICSISFSMNKKYLAYGNAQNKFFVQSILKNETVYNQENVTVYSSVFCFEDKRLVYSAYLGDIHIIDDHFNLIDKLNVNYIVYRLLVNKNHKEVLVSDCQSFCSCVDVETVKLTIGEQKIKDEKKLMLKYSKEKVFFSLPRVNIS